MTIRLAIRGQLAFACLHAGILSDIFLMYILSKEEFFNGSYSEFYN